MKIKERALAVLLSMVMMLTFMPALAFAGGEECEHNSLEHSARQEATCVDTGMEAYWYCNDCEKYFRDVDGEMDSSVSYDSDDSFIISINPDNHPSGLEYEEGYDATCGHEGEISHYVCWDCEKCYKDPEGTIEIADITIPATGDHNLEYYEEKESTLVEHGCIEHWECSVCYKYFSDSDGTEEIDEDDVWLPKKEAPNQDDLDIIIEEDDEVWFDVEDVWDAIDKADNSIKSGNVTAAINDANAAASLAKVAQKQAAGVMEKLNQYINANKEDLSEEDIADLRSYVQETVDYANNAASEANKAVKKAAALKASKDEAARQGTYTAGLPKVKITKPKAAKKSVTVKWKKLNKKALKKGVTNIEVWVCPNKAFGAGDTVIKFAGKKKASLKVKGLKKGTYYVKVRAIKNVGGVKYYTSWSKVKKVTIKK